MGIRSRLQCACGLLHCEHECHACADTSVRLGRHGEELDCELCLRHSMQVRLHHLPSVPTHGYDIDRNPGTWSANGNRNGIVADRRVRVVTRVARKPRKRGKVGAVGACEFVRATPAPDTVFDYPCPWCGASRGYDQIDANVRCVSCRGAIDREVEAEIRTLARAIVVKLDLADLNAAERNGKL